MLTSSRWAVCLQPTVKTNQWGPASLAGGGQGIQDTYPAVAVLVRGACPGTCQDVTAKFWLAGASTNGQTAVFAAEGKHIGTILGQGLG